MGKLIEQILMPPERETETDHPTDEELAGLADGRIGEEERRTILKHINDCAGCYEIFKETLIDVAKDEEIKDSSITPMATESHHRRIPFAMAASILIILLVGGGLFYQSLFKQTTPRVASLGLDAELRSILMETSDLVWESGNRTDRLAALLSDRGLKVEELKKVVLVAAYQPSKSLFGPEETLKVHFKDGVAYLEILEKENNPAGDKKD